MRRVINWIAYLKNWSTWALIIYLAFANRLHAQPIPDYFPMHIGDTWTYKLTTGGPTRHWANQTIKITDTTVIKQKKYFVFEDKIYDLYYEPGKVYHNIHYYRKSDNGDIMKFNKLLNDEQLYYTFQRDSLYKRYLYYGELGIGKKWQISYIHTNITLRIPLGIFSQCYAYRFEVKLDSSNRALPLEIRYLAPNIGLLEVTAEGDDNFLVGAYISGKLIGDTTLTSVKEIARSNAPWHPILFQNYPNPFNHATHIAFYVPDFWTEPTQISIFDISGREVMTLVLPKMIRGNHETHWNGKNKQGKEVSNGIYMIRLTSGQFTKTIKMNYLR
jgi:hypothetical protein